MMKIDDWFLRFRECEWLFNTRDGRRQLAESADCFRMIVVHLNRAHSFTNLKSVQDDLSAFVMELAPPELDPGAQVWNEMCSPFFEFIFLRWIKA